jgi:hypothetical protein
MLRNLIRARRPAPETPPPSAPPLYYIDAFWCDRRGLYIKGWLHWGATPVTRASLVVDECRSDLSWFERADVQAHYPAASARCGFEVYVDCPPCRPAYFEVESANGIHRLEIAFPKTDPSPLPYGEVFAEFRRRVNAGGMTVLHIGSRLRIADSQSHAQDFPGGRYLGLDIHAAPGVNIVGDVHRLSELVEPGSIDAIFSISVIEHLELPWVAAAEINKVLKPGGLTFHSVPLGWPLHEMPNDFWRFTGEGLKVLFGPRFGFEVLESSVNYPASIHTEHRLPVFLPLPQNDFYTETNILSRKAGSALDFTDTGSRALAYPKD